MTTRTYYVPRNRIGLHVMNKVISKVECSVEDLKINHQSDTIRFAITCHTKDIPTVEKILALYNIM